MVTGLLAGYYDACSGWIGTVGRLAVFDFSMPYLQTSLAYFYRKKGSDTVADDMTGKTIGKREI